VHPDRACVGDAPKILVILAPTNNGRSVLHRPAAVESMRNPVTVDSEWDRQSVVPIGQTSIEIAVQQALAEG
jgi:hypothetical protein